MLGTQSCAASARPLISTWHIMQIPSVGTSGSTEAFRVSLEVENSIHHLYCHEKGWYMKTSCFTSSEAKTSGETIARCQV